MRRKWFVWVWGMFFGMAVACSTNHRGSADAPQKEKMRTEIEFINPSYAFGKVTEGETVMHTFKFRNIGNENLIISNIDTGCGCTTAQYTTEPIAPGREGIVEIAFNSSGRMGKQYKEIRIFANVPKGVVSVVFTAEVAER